MPDKDFFAKLDATVAAHAKRKADDASASDASLAATRDLMVRVGPLLERYKSEIEQRGIKVNLSVGADYMMFELMYAGGGYYGLEIQRGKVVTKFTEKGKAYTGASPADVGMSLEQFEDYLQRVVNDFMLHASQNGGWRRAGD